MSECPFQSRLSAFHDQELDADTAGRLQSHLATCAECTETLKGIRAVSLLLNRGGTALMSQMGIARLHATADAAARRRDVFPLARALCVAAASILVVAGAWLYETPTHPGGTNRVARKSGQESPWERLASGKTVPSVLESANDPNQTWLAVSDWMLKSIKREPGS